MEVLKFKNYVVILKRYAVDEILIKIKNSTHNVL